jgi:hypothetical protein
MSVNSLMTQQRSLNFKPIADFPDITRTVQSFNRLLAAILAVLIPVEIALARLSHLSGLTQLLAKWPGLLLLIVALLYCKRRRLQQLVDLAELAIWSAFSLLLCRCSFKSRVAARAHSSMSRSEPSTLTCTSTLR